MAPETLEKLKFLAWGIGIGIVGLWILGFNVFGWVTGSTAQERIDNAVLPIAAEFCASKFKADPNFEKHLAALKKEESWQRGRYIEEKGKWAVIVGDDAPKYGVADACAGKLSDLLK
jgi:hypothetical protein